MIRHYITWALAATLVLSMSACMPPPEPPVPDRGYLNIRNHIDHTKPCLVAKFAVVPVKLAQDAVYVPLKLNDVFTVGFLDTGSDTTMLTPTMAFMAKVPIDLKQPSHRGYGVAGGFNVQLAWVQKVQVGGILYGTPRQVGVVNFFGSDSDKVGMLVGGNMLDGFDWDIDFPHEKMTAFRTQNCHDIDPLWDTKSTALPITRGLDGGFTPMANLFGLPMNITIPVQFDNGALNAVFDTGARVSYLSRAGARKAGIRRAELERDPIVEMKAINGAAKQVRRHIVPELVVGEDLVRNFTVYVAEDFSSNDEPDMILGMNWIATHHVWLSYTTDSLYIDSGEKKPFFWKPAPKLDGPT